MASRINFVRQQGFIDAPVQSCDVRFGSLMWQPRVIGVLVVTGLVLQAWPYFMVLGIVLWWSALLPALNPFDALYNRLVAGPRRRALLGPAPGPRRFSQGMAGTFMLAIALSLYADWTRTTWIVEALLVVALGALVLGRFCLGSYLFLVLTGRAALANRTLPWARDELDTSGRSR